MAKKKLTKVQKEILEIMKERRADIVLGNNSRFQLYQGNSKAKTIQSDTFDFLKPWFSQLLPGVYTFREGAEISDAWRTEEIERQRAEAQRKREIKEEAYQALVRRLRNVFAAIERGDIDNVDYSSRLRFEYAGKWYNLVEE